MENLCSYEMLSLLFKPKKYRKDVNLLSRKRNKDHVSLFVYLKACNTMLVLSGDCMIEISVERAGGVHSNIELLNRLLTSNNLMNLG